MTFNASFVLHVHQGKHMYHCGGTLLYGIFLAFKTFLSSAFLTHCASEAKTSEGRKWLVISITMVLF